MLDVGIAASAIDAEAGMNEIGTGDGSGAPAKSAKSVTETLPLARLQVGLHHDFLRVYHLRHPQWR